MNAKKTGETALLTGASGGLGLDLSRFLARDGYDLVLVARRGDKLSSIAEEFSHEYGTTVYVCPADLDGSAGVKKVLDFVQKQSLTIDILINNAGIGFFGRFVDIPAESITTMVRLNTLALTELTRAFLPDMLRRHKGRIMNVASTAAFQPGPLMAVYYATKAYVLHLSEALDDEYHKSGVRITAFCPGPTRTDFHDRAGMDSSMPLLKLMDSAAAASIGYRGMLRGKRVVVPGLKNRIMSMISQRLPRRLATRIIHHIQEGRMGGR
ncbi:MAG: SDR family NAD(P)-dependent oxidoreductase [Chitinivibrionales bacterium]